MDDAVIRAMLKWPAVPAAYGWLSLDRRGRWRIRSGEQADAAVRFEPISNPSVRAFIGRNYLPDERGRWYFQNGPQRVFVSLDYAPLVFRLEAGGLIDQCARAVRTPGGAWLDEEGSLVVQAESGLGLLDDRDLATFSDGLAEGVFTLGSLHLPVGRVRRSELEGRFGFVRDPVP